MNSGYIQLSPFDVKQTYSPASASDIPTSLGQMAVTPDGRRFKFGFNNDSSTALAACKLAQGPALVAKHQGIVVSPASIGDMQITVTLGGTAATENQYAGGQIAIISGTGAPNVYTIKGHAAQTDTTGEVILKLFDPVVTAISGTVTANLWANPYSAAIICPTTRSGTVLGIPQVSIAAKYFGWFQVGGVACYLNDANSNIGLGLAPSTNTAGALMTVAATTNQIGVADQAGVTTAYQFCTLTIA